VGLEFTLLDERVVAAARAAALVLGVWTVNDEAAMRRMLALGVDVLTTDRPDLPGGSSDDERAPAHPRARPGKLA